MYRSIKTEFGWSKRSMKSVFTAMVLVGLSLAPLHAMGRKPKPDQGYPDYNRLEMHPKATNAPPAEISQASTPPPMPRPFLNTSTSNLPSDTFAAPKPPPTVVPVPDGASEPVLPDDMMNTLVPGTTGQK